MKWPILMVVAVAAISCSESVSSFGPGLHQQVRVRDAQLHRGPLGADEGGPDVSQVLRPQGLVARGEASVMLRGRLGADGVALHIHAEGDPDHWVLLPRGEDFVVSNELLFAATLDFAHSIQDDTIIVELQAADSSGRLGPIAKVEFTLSDEVPASELLVSLAWDAPVDLDLYVRTPDGTVVGSKNINSYEPTPGQVPDPDAWQSGGFLDYDSNQHCELDLRNRENVVWLEAPPSGTYRVYAHLFSPCDAQSANMAASVHLGDELLEQAGATQYAFDSRIHPVEGEAPGLLMLEVSVP